ncbi:RNA polymerase sigma factor [Streptomyces sp. AC602_WCS936]|uniref:RNA polymerase sigma factor n=1 Tax=Streptomyces sp. AC602_WCS936 TaxID=2823685 RepID=UPI001C2589B4|nr:sigma-70 family RNA polymerase sigma factor [Streptomyces sp. AC602_WCS936]
MTPPDELGAGGLPPAGGSVELRDAAAFYTRYASKCALYVKSLREHWWWGVSPYSPEDIVHDAFVVVLRKWDEVGRMTFPYAYLREVARNLLRRSAERVYEHPVEDFTALDLTVPEDTADAGLAEREMVLSLIHRLPARQAQVLVLDSYGYTDSGIGDILGLAPATVRSHRRHMHKQLQTSWKEQTAV